ncbi:MAG: hypothetical protein E6J51_02870, partial [Chloroflexi bacterium]
MRNRKWWPLPPPTRRPPTARPSLGPSTNRGWRGRRVPTSCSTAASSVCTWSAADGRCSPSVRYTLPICRRWPRWRPALTSWRSRASTAQRSRTHHWTGCCAKPDSAPRRRGSSSGRSGGRCLPEGDTIWRTAAALRRRIGGKVVSEARPDSIGRLKGRRVESVEPNGKHLVMQFEGGIGLHSHMRMTGAWHLYQVGERWRQPERRATAVLRFDDV